MTDEPHVQQIPEMSPSEFKRAVTILFAGDYDAVSAFFSHAPGSKAVRRWASGEVAVSKPAAILLRAAVRGGLDLEAVRALAMEPLPRKGQRTRGP